MNIGYVRSTGRGELDTRIHDIATSLSAQGLVVVGLVQINTEREMRDHCDMDLQVLPDGPLIRINQDLGAGARGCRMDVAALENAVAEVGKRLSAEVDLLVINKFGKREAEGGGFRETIANALALGIRVLVGVNTLNFASFMAFVDGQADELTSFDEVIEWSKLGVM